MSEAQPHREFRGCPNCGGERLIRDGATGEVACALCGTVVSDVEYVPEYTPNFNRGSFAFVKQLGSGKPSYFEVLRSGERYLRMVGRDGERTEANVAAGIATVAGRIGAPKPVEEEGMYRARCLLKAMRARGRRLTTEEIVAVSLWVACKMHGFPVTMDEYVHALGWSKSGANNAKSLLKLLNKAEGIAPLPKGIIDPKLYVGKLAARLTKSPKASPRYISALEVYARALCDAVAGEVSGKDPVCVAATALCVADELMGQVFGRAEIERLTGAGYSPPTARAMRRRAAPPPERIRDVYLKSIRKKVMEVRVSEMVGNAAN